MTRYYKIIDEVKVIFTPPLISGGIAYMRPTAEQLEDDGWESEEWTPPEPEPIPQSEPDEYSVLRSMKKMMLSQLENLTDEQALEVAECYPTWESKIGQTLSIGERVWDDGHIYKVNQTHTASREWRPASTASLYTVIALTPEEGTIDNPIAYVLNMELVEGKYYTDNGVLYLCTRDLAASYWPLADLVGQYVEVVNS